MSEEKSLTPQEAFNAVWQAFVVEKRPFGRDSIKCVYRGPNGERCAVGVLLRDEEYSRSMEGCNVTTGAPFPPRFAESVVFLGRLQRIHDVNARNGDYTTLTDQLRALAWEYNLIIPAAA